MRKPIFSAIAIAAMAFTACTEQPINPVEPSQETVTVNFVSGNELGGTKTYIDENNNVFWNETGEYLKIFETIDGTTNVVDSKEGVVATGNKTATFSAEFTANTTGTSYVYNAIYPKTAYAADTDLTKIKVSTPAIQNPTKTSFDPTADLLISKPVTRPSQPGADESISLNFARVVAVAKIGIYGLGTTDPVTSVVFTAPAGIALNGRTSVNLTAGEIVSAGYYEASNAVTMNYTDAPDFTKTTKEEAENAIFTCIPCEIAPGETFTVTVATANAKYVKECTVPESGNPIAFKSGKSTKLTVNFTGVEPAAEAETYDLLTDVSDLAAGDKIVIAQLESNVAMGSQNGSVRGKVDNIVVADNKLEIAADYQIIIVENGINAGTYAFNVGNSEYLSWNSGNTLNTTDTKDINSSWTISFVEDAATGKYVTKILNAKDNTRSLQYNSGSPRFACYTSSQKAISIFYKKDTRTEIAPVTELTAALAEGVNNTVVLTWTGVENANQYVVSYDGAEPVTVTETTATIEGLEPEQAYTFSVVAKNTDEITYKASSAATVNITTGSLPQLTWPEGATFTASVPDAENAPRTVELEWTAIPEATSYVITSGELTKTVTEGTSTTIECPAYDTPYTFTIVAKADTHKDSEPKEFNEVTTGSSNIVVEELTIAEFLAKPVSTDAWYQLTGTISNIDNPTFGNFDLVDANGDKVRVYGLTKAKVDDNDRSFASLGLEEGYTLTLIGTRAEYQGNAQIGGPAYYVNHVVAPVLKVDFTSLSFAAAGESKDVAVTVLNTEETVQVTCDNNHFSVSGPVDGKYTVTAAANETEAEITGTLTITVAGLTKNVTLTQAGKPAEGGSEAQWTLVTDASTLAAGDKVVIAYSNFAMGAQNGTYRDKIDVNIANGVLTMVDDIEQLTLEAGSATNSFAFKATDGKYLDYSGSKNTLTTSSTSVADECSWTIAIKNNEATIVNIGDAERHLQYNTSSPRFACYKNTQKKVNIYKLTSN